MLLFFVVVMLMFLVFVFFLGDMVFISILDVFWWVIVIMIIVGYGDMFLKLIFGYFVGGVCVFLGMFILVMLVVIFVMNFNDLY